MLFSIKQTKIVSDLLTQNEQYREETHSPLVESEDKARSKLKRGAVAEWLISNEHETVVDTPTRFVADVVNEAAGTRTRFVFTIETFDTINSYFDKIQQNSASKRSIQPKDLFQHRRCC